MALSPPHGVESPAVQTVGKSATRCRRLGAKRGRFSACFFRAMPIIPATFTRQIPLRANGYCVKEFKRIKDFGLCVTAGIKNPLLKADFLCV